MVKTVKVTLNGQTYNLTLDSASGKYKATLIAPAQTSWNVNAGHYYPVTVEAEDNAGNKVVVNDSDAQFGAALKLRVKETVAPVIALTYPTSAARITNSKPTFAWTAPSCLSLSTAPRSPAGSPPRLRQTVIPAPIPLPPLCRRARTR